LAIIESVSVLESIDFGIGAAQQEQHLKSYFYRSGSFKLASSDKTYLILGAKGAGKSAIFQMLQELHREIPVFKHPNIWVADEPQLRDHWATLKNIGISSHVTLWRFYVASLIAKICLEQDNLPDELQKAYKRFLVRWNLVAERPTAWQAAKLLKFRIGFGDFLRTEIPLKIPLAVTEIDYVIFSANQWLDESGADLWVCLDSLDEVGLNGQSRHDETEDLLSSMMRAVGELIRSKRIRFKLFFRTDIYHSLTYVNKDHFSAVKLELQWSKEDLAILLAHRLQKLHPNHHAAPTFPVSLNWVNEVFDWPAQRDLKGFDDLYGFLKDGNGDVLPRDLINFCIEAQKLQLNFNIQGINEPAASKLVCAPAIKQAFVQTAASKLKDFLQVFQNFNKTYDQLKGSQSSVFHRAELSAALGKRDPLDADLVIADLVRVGALAIKDRKSVNQSDNFEIPFLYALALEIGDTYERI
jgi:hypothetical protein